MSVKCLVARLLAAMSCTLVASLPLPSAANTAGLAFPPISPFPPIPDVLRDPLAANPEQLASDPLRVCVIPNLRELGSTALVLSLADAVDLALCQNPQVKAAWAGIKVQAGSVGEAKAAYLPTLNLTANRLFNRTAYPDSDIVNHSHGTTKYANLSWRLFNFGGREANLAAAQQLLLSAVAAHEATVQKLFLGVITAYFEAQTATAVYESRTKTRSLAESTLSATKRREASGAVAMSDVLQAQTALAKARLAEERAKGEMFKTQAVLANILGLPAETRLQLPETPPNTMTAEQQTLSAWLDEAKRQHPGIIAAETQLQASQAKIAALRAEGLASVDFSYNYYENGYPNQGLSSVRSHVSTYGLTLTIPLFEGFSRTYRIRGAEAQAEQNAARLQETMLQVSLDVVKAYADLQATLGNLQASLNLLQAAEAAVQSSERRYHKGVAEVLELLSTQGSLAEARQERLRCVAEWQAARFKLWATVGALAQIPSQMQQRLLQR